MAMSRNSPDRAPFRVVVREVVNLFEDESSESVADGKQERCDTETFEMSAHPRQTSLRTMIVDPDTEFQGKEEVPDEFQDERQLHDEEDLFDESFQAPPTPRGLSSKTAPAKNSEEDDDIFGDIDTQAFHVSSKHLKREVDAKLIKADEGEPTRNSKTIIEASTETKAVLNENVAPNGAAMNHGFRTAGGKNVNVSATALAAVKRMLEDEDNLSVRRDSKEELAAKRSSREISTEVLPSGTTILHHSAGLTNDRDDTSGSRADLGSPQLFTERPVKQGDKTDERMGAFEGFKTAGGKSVPVSAKHLETARMMFENEISQVPVSDHANKQVKARSSHSTVGELVAGKLHKTGASLVGFVSARGTAVKVSARALESARRLFQEELPENSLRIANVAVNRSSGPGAFGTSGFFTAAGKNVPVREEYLKAVRDIVEKDTIPTTASTSAVTESIGFSTASGRRVPINPQHLNAACKILEEDTVVAKPSDRPVPEISAFSTAAGSAVPINEKHLKAVRRILEEDPKHGTPVPKIHVVSAGAPERNMRLLSDADTEEKKNKAGGMQSKTPIRRISGLKRRSTPMCHTPLNGPTSPISPLEPHGSLRTTRSGRQTTSRETSGGPVTRNASANRQAKTSHPSKNQGLPICGLPTTAGTSKDASSEGSQRKTLGELTLVDRPPAPAGADWFQDDESASKVHLSDVKEIFSKTFNTSSNKDFDLWFANHFEQVVWKLSSYSGRIHELASCLTMDNVLEQLQNRWRLEVQGTHRSPLKLIVERDESSERTMVLVVKQTTPELVLSDGWYSIPCDVDPPLAALLSRTSPASGISVGHKLCVSGAILRGARNGVHPLHLEGARLWIHYNSTRRARWFARLGFCRQTLAVPLFSAQPNGGSLPLIRVHVTSCSSLMYFEKFAQGGSIIRKESEEIKERRKFEGEIGKIQERVRDQVCNEMEAENRSKSKRKLRPRGKVNVSNLNSGEEIYEAVEASHDPSQLLADLSSSQKRMLERYHDNVRASQCARIEEAVRRKMEELRQREECPLERKVASLLKLLVRCVSSGVEIPLTIWRPSEELRALLSRPDVVVAILRANVTSCRNFPLGLTTTQSTKFHCLTSSSSPIKKKGSDQKREKRVPNSPVQDGAVPTKRPRVHQKI